MINQVVAAICSIRKTGTRKDGRRNEEELKTSRSNAEDSGQPEDARV